LGNSVSDYYDCNVQKEWNRLQDCFAEFHIVKKYLDRYIGKGYSVLDLGGGPGRLSIYLAHRNTRVLLVDISSHNIEFAQKQAQEEKCNIKTIVGDARQISQLVQEKFDAILLLGPIYHILDNRERVDVINQCIKLLKQGGILFVGFISSLSRVIYALRDNPSEILTNTLLKNDLDANLLRKNIYRYNPEKILMHPTEIQKFMLQFPLLRQLELIGCEGILGPFLTNLSNCEDAVKLSWLEYAFELSSFQELLFFSEHIMYIGQKVEDE
jgi:2-polyprenyl-3-methyl-5-hydroxy-6-metoxy-1,4-benzoquinol methylase